MNVRRMRSFANGETRLQQALRQEEPPKHFAGRLTLANIYGGWWPSVRDGFFTVRWGRFYAYLHQFDPASRATLIEACEAGQNRRDHAHGLLAWGD